MRRALQTGLPDLNEFPLASMQHRTDKDFPSSGAQGLYCLQKIQQPEV